ncbi:MAG: hypothetical protein L0Z51_07350 [Candidatus Latescibacteria bacterium]|nr:hypothetical protein [Candidatus Latescibacterota bacterium]
MKKFVLTVLALVAIAAPAAAQLGDLSAYADQAGTSCNISDAAVGAVNVYLIHKHGGASASQFGLELTGGATLFPTGFNAATGMLWLGTYPSDVSVSYGASCVQGDFLIGTAGYFGQGTSPACSRIRFVPAPTSVVPGSVAAVDCTAAFVALPTGQGIINADLTCQCDVPVNETTWGGVKALYR